VQFTFLSVTFVDPIDPTSLDSELVLLLFVDDLAVPRAKVKLSDVIRQDGRRPLNLRHAVGEPVRLTIADPTGTWITGVCRRWKLFWGGDRDVSWSNYSGSARVQPHCLYQSPQLRARIWSASVEVTSAPNTLPLNLPFLSE
jgi:hypothetical protein